MATACTATDSHLLLAASPWPSLALPRTPLDPLHFSPLSPSFSPSLVLLSHAPENHRRRRSPLPCPEPLPRLPVVSKRTAPSPYSSSPRHTGREALLRPEHRRLLPWDPAIPVVAPSTAGLPRARRALQLTCCEPPVILPLTPRPFPHRGRRVHRGRSSPPLELVAGVAPATIWSSRANQHARRIA